MGRVSYQFSCGWEEPTISMGDIYWIKYMDRWQPIKVSEILLDYNEKYRDYLNEHDDSFCSHATFKCEYMSISPECEYEAERYSNLHRFVEVDEYDIGQSVFARNPDEKLEEYYKRKGKI